MTDAQKKVIAELAKHIARTNPLISKIRAERIAPLVPVHIVDMRVVDDTLELVPNRDLECFIVGLGIGIQSERD